MSRNNPYRALNALTIKPAIDVPERVKVFIVACLYHANLILGNATYLLLIPRRFTDSNHRRQRVAAEFSAMNIVSVIGVERFRRRRPKVKFQVRTNPTPFQPVSRPRRLRRQTGGYLPTSTPFLSNPAEKTSAGKIPARVGALPTNRVITPKSFKSACAR